MAGSRISFRKMLSRRRTRTPSPRPPERSRYAVQNYTRSDLRLLTSPNHFFFPSATSPLIRLLTQQAVRFSPIRLVDCIHGLRTQKDLLSFDIYPTCSHTLSANSVLHEAAQKGSFDSAELENVLGVHVLALGLAPELHQFLSVTPKEEIDTAIVDFLVLLYHQLEAEGDVDAIHRMEEDLEPSINDRLQDTIGIFPDGEPPPGRRANILEQIVQLAFLTPWRVDVWGAYLTPTEVLDLRSGLVTTGNAASAKMLKDWIVYSDVLQNVAPDWGIADGLERAICEGQSEEVFSRARLVSKLAHDFRSWLSILPREVVEGSIIPWLVRKECETMPSRRRQMAPLQCTQAGVCFLDELEAAGDDMITRLAAERDGLSLWRDFVSAHLTGSEQTQNLCYSLDAKPWDGAVVDGAEACKIDGNEFGSPLSSGNGEDDDGDDSLRRQFVITTDTASRRS